MSYHLYGPMLASAQRRTGLWRTLAGIAIVTVTSVILTPLFFVVLRHISPNLNALTLSSTGTLEMGTTPAGLLVILASFGLLLSATLLSGKWLHDRTLKDLAGPTTAIKAQFWTVFKWAMPAACLILILPWDGPTAQIIRQYALSNWLLWLPFGLLGLMLQVTAEEVFFRGYVQTQLIAHTKSYTAGMLIAALLFGAGHISFTVDGPAAYMPALWATAFGLFAGDLTARTGSLGPAISIHFVNNTLAIFLAPVAGELSGFGLYLTDVDLNIAYSDPFLICFEGISLLILWLIARLALKR